METVFIKITSAPKETGVHLTNLGFLHYNGVWSYDEAKRHSVNKDAVEYYLKEVNLKQLIDERSKQTA